MVFTHPRRTRADGILRPLPRGHVKACLNEEAGANTHVTVTFEENDGKTLVVHDANPSKTALDEAIATGTTSGISEEILAQLEALRAATDGV